MRPLFQAYLITCRVSGRLYVGITTRGLRKRWTDHVSLAMRRGGKMPVCAAIRKHGEGQFSIESIFSAFSWEDLCAAERMLIEQWQTRVPQGYNVAAGGAGPFGVRRSPKSVELSASKHRGKPCHPNTRAAGSRTHKGVPKSAQHRARIAASRVGKHHTEETRSLLSRQKIGKPVNAGEANAWAKLTADQVREARIRLAAGESQRSIARLFGVKYNAIWKVAHGLTWRCAA